MKKYIPFMRLQNYEGDNKLKVSDIKVSHQLRSMYVIRCYKSLQAYCRRHPQFYF